MTSGGEASGGEARGGEANEGEGRRWKDLAAVRESTKSLDLRQHRCQVALFATPLKVEPISK